MKVTWREYQEYFEDLLKYDGPKGFTQEEILENNKKLIAENKLFLEEFDKWILWTLAIFCVLGALT